MNQHSFLSKKCCCDGLTGMIRGIFGVILVTTAMSGHAASTAANSIDPTTPLASTNQTSNQTTSSNTSLDIDDTLAAQLQPSNEALSNANQELLSRNAQLQRQVNDLQTQVNVLVYESKGQLFLYGAFTVLISLLVGVFISWLVFVRRERW
ncbi:MAG: hypothetical protein ACTHZO_05165 [Moraxellaceae bacterium]